MKAKAFKIINLILAVLVCVFALGNAFAWFAEDMREAEQKYDGSSGSPYFESGTGASDDPFIISNAYHMYNLAWLQNTGKLNDKQYYFKLKNDITIADHFWLPPIGTDTSPFKGVFDGSGKTITGLKVTTDTNKLNNMPSNRDAFSNAVGMFGMTAENAEVTNFTLKEPLVEVYNNNEIYSSSASKTVGFAIGYANCGASNIGVYNGKLNVGRENYTTVNSIIGGYNSEVVDGSGIDGSGSGYGRSMDLQELYNELGGDGKGLSSGYALPFLHDSSASYTAGGSKNVTVGETLTSITNSGGAVTSYELSGTKTVSATVSKTKAANANNIGYFVGSDIKAYRKTSVSYDKFYYPNNAGDAYELPATIGGVTYNAPDTGIIDYLNEEVDGYKRGYYILRSSSTHRLNKLNNTDGYQLIESGIVGSYSGNVLVPVRSIWVAPIYAGTLRIVLVNPESSTTYVTIVKLTRSEPKDYSTYFSKVEAVLGDMSTGTNTTNDWPLESGKAYYFEIEVTQSDIDAGYEYAIVNNGTGPYFAYLDLGTSGGEGGGGASKATLKNIDFTYLDTANNSVVLVEANSFVPTLVVVTFSDVTLLYFIREDDDGTNADNKTLEVQYNGAAPSVTTGADNAFIHEDTNLSFPTS